LAASVVALAMALNRTPPRAGKGADDQNNELAGYAEGLARRGEGPQAREFVAKNKPHDQLRFWAQVNLAAASVDASGGERSDLDVALELARRRGNQDAHWLQWRLLHMSLRSGADDESLKLLVERLPVGPMRSRGQLAVFRDQLARSGKAESEDMLATIP